MKRLGLALLLLALGVVAQAANQHNNMAICPAAHELHMDGKQHWWATIVSQDVHAKNRKLKLKWYSTSPSLAKGISHFAGAQYLGSTEGHIVCFYIPKVTFQTKDFPVLVYFENLVTRPHGGNWEADRKNRGQFNCISNDPSACPYLLYEPEYVQDPYKALRELG
jgi:hypothetical protein